MDVKKVTRNLLLGGITSMLVGMCGTLYTLQVPEKKAPIHSQVKEMNNTIRDLGIANYYLQKPQAFNSALRQRDSLATIVDSLERTPAYTQENGLYSAANKRAMPFILLLALGAATFGGTIQYFTMKRFEEMVKT